jgi:hypothetical protein
MTSGKLPGDAGGIRPAGGARTAMSAGTAVVLVGLVALCVVLWLLRAALETEPVSVATVPANAADSPTVSAPPPQAAAVALPPPADPALPPPAQAPDLHGTDTVDPCTSPFDPEIPAGYETVVADGITVAWRAGAAPRQGPYDAIFQPTTLAYFVKGVLAEAAAMTGTVPREQLTVIVHPSRARLRAMTHVPSWAAGVYDGGAVSVAVNPRDSLGVDSIAVRHELMHAQLHSAVGCMPAWFNEGTAMYFAGSPPIHAWLQMLRRPEAFDVEPLQASSFALLPDDRAERAYAESLAMVVYLVEHAGEPGVKTAVQTLRAARHSPSHAGLDLWDRLYPATPPVTVVDALARRIFGVAAGRELDGILQGVVCCHGVRSVTALGCRGAAPRPDEKYWIDETRLPHALCDTTW